MGETKPFSEFSIKDWRNFGLYIILIGLIIAFVGDNAKLGIGFMAVGVIFLVIFKGLIR